MALTQRIEAGADYTARAVGKHLYGIRFSEVIVMQGPPLMGAVFSVAKPQYAMIPPLAIFMSASFFLVAHIWSLNDWSDYWEDRTAARRHSLARSSEVTRTDLLRFSIGSLVASLAFFCFLPWKTLIIAGAIAALGFIYSFPGIRVKGLAGLSSLSHFIGGILHFLLGYSLFGDLDWRAFLISIFFALVFMAGHATQEVQDYETDRASGVRTNAVAFGQRAVFLAAFICFAMAFLYLGCLAATGIVPARLGFSALVFPLQAAWTFHVLHSGLAREKLMWLRSRYRMAFGLIGLNILSLLF